MITWIITAFSSPLGVIVLAALDSTPFVTLPFGIDGAVLIGAAGARGGSHWMIPCMATIGSTIGAAFTFWMGRKIGEHGLEKHVSKKRLARIHAMLKTRGAVAFAALDLMPPPFPFTPFLLAAGALQVDITVMFVTLTLCRIIRFGLESYFANRYGPYILNWLNSPAAREIVTGCIVLAVGLSIFSIVKITRATKPARRRHHAAA